MVAVALAQIIEQIRWLARNWVVSVVQAPFKKLNAVQTTSGTVCT